MFGVFCFILTAGNMYVSQKLHLVPSRKLGGHKAVERTTNDTDAAPGRILPGAKCASKYVHVVEAYMTIADELRSADGTIVRLKDEAKAALAGHNRDLADRGREIAELEREIRSLSTNLKKREKELARSKVKTLKTLKKLRAEMIKAKAQFTRPQFSYDPASAMEEPKLSDITIGIKTFSRPDLLKFTLGKLREDYDSSVRIIVADDSKDDHKRENERIIGGFKNVDHITLPFDTGISVGRNALVDATRTHFFLLLDDSRYVTKDTPLLEMAKFLHTSDYDLVGGVILSGRIGINQHYAGKFVSVDILGEDKYRIKVEMRVDQVDGHLAEIQVDDVNIVLNVFLATTESLQEVRWSDDLKIGEHEDFFFRYFKRDKKCGLCRGCQFSQASDNLRKYPGSMESFRKRSFDEKTSFVPKVEIDWLRNGQSIAINKLLSQKAYGANNV